jgi:hypothetical protein
MEEGDDNYQAQAGGRKKGYEDDVAGFSFKGDGIVRAERGCTDLPCLFVFLAFIVSMGYVTLTGFREGDIQRLIAPIDGEFKFCGIEEGYEEYKNLYIADFTQTTVDGIFGSAVCVKVCPTKASDEVECKPTSTVPDCKPTEAYASKTVVNICFPTEVPDTIKEGLKMMK